MLHQIKHIALGGTLRVPPAMPVAVDNQDLALAAVVFQGVASALPVVEPPAGRPTLQQRGATDLTAEQNSSSSASLVRMVCLSCGEGDTGFPSIGHLWPSRSGDREAAVAQGGSRHGRARGTPRYRLRHGRRKR